MTLAWHFVQKAVRPAERVRRRRVPGPLRLPGRSAELEQAAGLVLVLRVGCVRTRARARARTGKSRFPRSRTRKARFPCSRTGKSERDLPYIGPRTESARCAAIANAERAPFRVRARGGTLLRGRFPGPSRAEVHGAGDLEEAALFAASAAASRSDRGGVECGPVPVSLPEGR